MAGRRLSPYPMPTWRDRVHSALRGAVGVAIVLALCGDYSWWGVLALGLVAFSWSVYLAIRDVR